MSTHSIVYIYTQFVWLSYIHVSNTIVEYVTRFENSRLPWAIINNLEIPILRIFSAVSQEGKLACNSPQFYSYS